MLTFGLISCKPVTHRVLEFKSILFETNLIS